MKLNRITWTLYFFIAVISLVVWFKISYPSLAFTDFSVDRQKALSIAKQHLKTREVDPSSFSNATVLISERHADQYLQKAIGFNKLKIFIKKHDFDMFFWIVRFFNEQEQEEYRITVSSATGEVTGLSHTIDDHEVRKVITEEEAQQKALAFLIQKFQMNPDVYVEHKNVVTPYDNRTDYFFSWQKKGVNIKWSKKKDTGTGKLITSASVSGDEIVSFSKNTFLIPNQFHRYLAQKSTTGVSLSYIIQLLYTLLFASTIFFIIARRNHLAMHATKKFYIGVMLLTFVLSLLVTANHFQDVLFNYQTTKSFKTYFLQLCIGTFKGALFATIGLLMPSLAGELLHYETFKEKREGSFLYYIQSSFFSRHVTEMICLGYITCIIMLGLQSVITNLGQQYLGVWVERTWIENLSASQFPFLSSFTYGLKTSFLEEIMYRVFALCLFKKIYDKILPGGKPKNTFLAVVTSAVIWGLAHTGYPVFPMWFRGLELTCLGLFMSFIYLRYGIIPVIIGHFLFNTFWHSAEHLLGVSPPFYFYSALGVLSLPFAFGLIAFMVNGSDVMRPMRWQLNKHQLYNLNILKTYLNFNTKAFISKTKEEINQEIIPHGWDPAVVDTAAEDFLNENDINH